MTAPRKDVDDLEVEFDNHIRFLDVVDLVFTRATLSPGMQLFAGFFTAIALVALLAGVGPDVWVPILLVGVMVGTGILLLPFTWTTYQAVPELTREKVEADLDGMLIHVLNRIVEHPWPVYRTAIETPRLFILQSRIVPTQIFTKRGIPPADVDTFREILKENELLNETSPARRRKAVIGFVVGAVIAVLLPLVFGALSAVVPA